MTATQKEIQALADAAWQCLDDMGTSGHSVCLYAKAQLRAAYEPFRTEEQHADEFPLSEALDILEPKRRNDQSQRRDR